MEKGTRKALSNSQIVLTLQLTNKNALSWAESILKKQQNTHIGQRAYRQAVNLTQISKHPGKQQNTVNLWKTQLRYPKPNIKKIQESHKKHKKTS